MEKKKVLEIEGVSAVLKEREAAIERCRMEEEEIRKIHNTDPEVFTEARNMKLSELDLKYEKIIKKKKKKRCGKKVLRRNEHYPQWMEDARRVDPEYSFWFHLTMETYLESQELLNGSEVKKAVERLKNVRRQVIEKEKNKIRKNEAAVIELVLGYVFRERYEELKYAVEMGIEEVLREASFLNCDEMDEYFFPGSEPMLRDYFECMAEAGFDFWMSSEYWRLTPAICAFLEAETDLEDVLLEVDPEETLRNPEDSPYLEEVIEKTVEEFGTLRAMRLVAESLEEKGETQNALYWVEDIMGKIRERERIAGRMQKMLPEKAVDLFPAARRVKRHFVIHAGPTNSGKTFEALREMKRAGSGIYLAPLRMMALEKYTELNQEGFPCSLLTGEEAYVVEGACLQSSTTEMLDIGRRYEVCVLDECQMTADRSRGGAWTRAILGVQADRIHLCAPEYAVSLLIHMILACGDTYERIEHTCLTPLRVEKEHFSFPEDVRSGDALIVFSRQSVHYAAGQLLEEGIKCSFLYGSLPAEVRKMQAERFAERKTKILVATDVIGMGMNLPIERVVFLEMTKFDGVRRRTLEPEEVQQIAGRAGRYKMTENRWVNAEYDPERIRILLEKEVPELTQASLAFPETLLEMEGKASWILEEWEKQPEEEGFVKADTEKLKRLCRYAEEKGADKKTAFALACLPFDDRKEELFTFWKKLVKAAISGTEGKYKLMDSDPVEELEELEELELEAAKCMLYLSWLRRFAPEQETCREALTYRKEMIAGKIMEILDRQKPIVKRCGICKKKLPWHESHGMCRDCYRRKMTFERW